MINYTERQQQKSYFFFLTGNYILVAILLLVLLRLCYQTVIQRLKILKVLRKRENRCSPINPNKVQRVPGQ